MYNPRRMSVDDSTVVVPDIEGGKGPSAGWLNVALSNALYNPYGRRWYHTYGGETIYRSLHGTTPPR